MEMKENSEADLNSNFINLQGVNSSNDKTVKIDPETNDKPTQLEAIKPEVQVFIPNTRNDIVVEKREDDEVILDLDDDKSRAVSKVNFVIEDNYLDSESDTRVGDSAQLGVKKDESIHYPVLSFSEKSKPVVEIQQNNISEKRGEVHEFEDLGLGVGAIVENKDNPTFYPVLNVQEISRVSNEQSFQREGISIPKVQVIDIKDDIDDEFENEPEIFKNIDSNYINKVKEARSSSISSRSNEQMEEYVKKEEGFFKNYMKDCFYSSVFENNQDPRPEQKAVGDSIEILKNDPKELLSKNFLIIREIKETNTQYLVYKYINYEIIEVNNGDAKIISCRRYNHFYKFDKLLRKKYPQYLIPLLPQKNFYTIIGNVDKEFLDKRRFKLSIYLNFLYKHLFFSKQCKELQTFLYTSEFLDQHYTLKESDELFSETVRATSEDLKEKISNTLGSIYNSIIKTTCDKFVYTEEYNHFKDIGQTYKKRLECSSSFKDEINNFAAKLKEGLKNNQSILRAFELVYSNKIDVKAYMELYTKMTSFSNSRIFEEMTEIQNKMEIYVSILGGLCLMNDRLEATVEFGASFTKAKDKAKKYPELYNYQRIKEEEVAFGKFYSTFVQNIKIEMNDFRLKHENFYTIVKGKFLNVLSMVNIEELEKLQ